MAETPEEKLARIEGENIELKRSVDNLAELKGRMGREIGELRAHSKSSPVIDENIDPEVVAQQLLKNPRQFIKKAFSEDFNAIRDENASLKNTLNYLVVTKLHPEYENKDFQRRVMELQEQEKIGGRELDTMTAIDKLKMSDKEADLIKREEAIKVSGKKLDGEKNSTFGGTSGGNSAGSADTVKTEGDGVIEGIMKYAEKDATPF